MGAWRTVDAGDADSVWRGVYAHCCVRRAGGRVDRRGLLGPAVHEQATCAAAAATWTAGSCSADGYPTEAECEGTESPRSAVYVFPMGDGTPGIRHARFKSVAGVTAAPLTKHPGARLR